MILQPANGSEGQLESSGGCGGGIDAAAEAAVTLAENNTPIVTTPEVLVCVTLSIIIINFQLNILVFIKHWFIIFVYFGFFYLEKANIYEKINLNRNIQMYMYMYIIRVYICV